MNAYIMKILTVPAPWSKVQKSREDGTLPKDDCPKVSYVGPWMVTGSSHWETSLWREVKARGLMETSCAVVPECQG